MKRNTIDRNMLLYVFYILILPISPHPFSSGFGTCNGGVTLDLRLCTYLDLFTYLHLFKYLRFTYLRYIRLVFLHTHSFNLRQHRLHIHSPIYTYT